jgi:ArsR family transcriptional regulator, arsenate/arsenite/antimonite-responsive transcriptional repressor
MDQRQALSAFAALSQDTRLSILRLLVTAAPEGCPAGLIADQVGVSASNVSFHLKELEHAGLVQARRDGRSIRYEVQFDALTGLVRFLLDDCCKGRTNLCLTKPATAGDGQSGSTFI